VNRKYQFQPVLFFILFLSTVAFAQGKKHPDHNMYDLWKRIEAPQISKDGKFILFEVNSFRKDGTLNIFDKDAGKTITIPRGKGAKISAGGEYVVALIKPGFDTLKSANLKKVKKDDLPKDSLVIYLTEAETFQKFSNIKSFQLPEQSTGWFAYLFDKEKPEKKEDKSKDSTSAPDSSQISPDSSLVKTEPSGAVPDTSIKAKTDEKPASKGKKEGTKFVVANPLTGKELHYENVESYTCAKDGLNFAFISFVDDSVDISYVVRVNVHSLSSDTLKLNGVVKSLVLSDDGKKLAFLFSSDTLENAKNFNLYLLEKGKTEPTVLIDSVSASLPPGMRVSQNYDLNFSESGRRLFYGVAKALEKEPDETLLDEEKPNVEVWSWHDPILQTQQNVELNKEKKKTFLFVYDFDQKNAVQLTDSLIESVSYSTLTDNNFAMGTSSIGYQQLGSWEDFYSDIYSVDMRTGKRTLVAQKNSQYKNISPHGNFIVWYDVNDSTWYSWNNNTNQKNQISNGIDAPIWDVENDVPALPGAYGIGGWSEDDSEVLIYSQFDVWLADANGKNKPINITNGANSKTEFRALILNRKKPWFAKNDDIYFRIFDKVTKESGFAAYSPKEKKTVQLIKTPNFYTWILKAENSNDVIFSRESVSESPDVYFSHGFSTPVKISDINPQQKDYYWANVQLVKYHSIDGVPLEGLLYVPDNLDVSKKYPMLVYYYEKYSENRYRYWTPGPSRSIINPSFYAGNDYVIFIPDIVYQEGFPGKSAYNCIVGGTLEMIDQFPFIDRDRIGLQGQSWGGYQTAYLITQTNLYKAAMAGAPVSNMTSAYGGIRWGSGLVREFQYEKGQSRIGASLWDKLELYIENSPLFYLDRVNTPLLIMSNDKDDAVPWYQGIELFTGLRRLGKPVWLLNYTGDVHNLKETSWGNRVDLSIRMMQFFDHYLKGTAAPDWMTKGVKAIERDKVRGY